ncbi:MAG TPA: chalcone isomerase family protein [Azospira sp.]|nr:chalcone isomerase family protein [Azospira sp.]
MQQHRKHSLGRHGALILLGLTSLFLTLPLAARATEVAGVKFEDSARIDRQAVVLNGAGQRAKFFLRVYAMGLYLPEKNGDVDGILAAKGAKRITIVPLMELSAQQFVDALSGGIEKNNSEAEIEPLKDRLQTFEANLLALGKAAKGTPISLDWLPERGTRLLVAGQPRGKDIPGEDFYRALLKIWLGQKPAQDDLKEALLGHSR